MQCYITGTFQSLLISIIRLNKNINDEYLKSLAYPFKISTNYSYFAVPRLIDIIVKHKCLHMKQKITSFLIQCSEVDLSSWNISVFHIYKVQVCFRTSEIRMNLLCIQPWCVRFLLTCFINFCNFGCGSYDVNDIDMETEDQHSIT